MSGDDTFSRSGVERSVLAELTDEQTGRLSQLLDDYLRSLEDGSRLDVAELARQHPDLAEVLSAYLRKLDELHGIAAGFQPAADGSDTASLPSAAGLDLSGASSLRLGDFTILREIGRGGMGVVYEARQHSLDRRVALKLLPMAAMLDSRQIARFRNESHAAGLLQHPHIVPVHSVGVERGIHYYAMQYIDGTPVDAWIRRRRESRVQDKQSNPSQPSGRSVAWRRVVRMAIDVADALHCAHESGVVHRDVKPSNLLIDANQKIWITDFGLARCQTARPENEQPLTVSGDLIGTMRYMSPEQAAGRIELIDHRTDIYSLAATLYEMLTLQPAVAGDDGPSLLRAIDQNDPPRLGKALLDAPRDLDVVLRKAMSKQKDNRYVSARQFADDLKAVLDGRATLAKPPSTASLVGRWTLRHRRMVTAGSLVLAVAVVWLCISSLVIIKTTYDKQDSDLRADLYFHQAQATVDHLGKRVAEQLASVPGAERIRQSLLNDTLEYYQGFVAQASGDPLLRSQLALTHNRIGSLVQELNSSADAIEHYRDSAALYHQIVQEGGDSPTIRQRMAQNWNHLGLALAGTGDFAEAKNAYDRAIAIQDDLVARHPDNLPYKTELALTNNNLGLLLRESGELEQARPLFENAIAHLSKLTAEDGENVLAIRGLAASLSNLSSLSLDSQPARSIRLLERAIDHQLAAANQSSNRLRASAEISTTYNNLGAAYLGSGQLDEAVKSFSNAIRLQRQLHWIAPEVESYRRELAISLNNLAMAQQKQADHRAAETSAREAIALQTSCLKTGKVDAHVQSRLGAMLHNLAVSLDAIGQPAEAEAAFRSAIDCQGTALSADPHMQSAESYRIQHFASLLKSQVRRAQWDHAESTSLAYRQAAAGDAEQLLRVATDLAEATRLMPRGSKRDRSVSAIAETLASAQLAGLQVGPGLLLQEPFLPFAEARNMRMAFASATIRGKPVADAMIRGKPVADAMITGKVVQP